MVRSKAGVGELGWRGGVEWVWDRSWVEMGGGTAGVGVGGRYSAHNKWQFSVWSGWLPSTGPLDCRGLLRGLWGEAEEEDERKQEGWHRFKESLQSAGALTPSHCAQKCTQTQLPPNPTPPHSLSPTTPPHREVTRYNNSNEESEMEEITESLQKIKPETAPLWL